MTSDALKVRSRKVLATMARRRGVDGWHSMTKDELVRALVRISRTKSSTPTKRSELNSPRGAVVRTPRNGASKGKAKSNGHSAIIRSRDLCTTEVEDRYPAGRTNYLDAKICDAHWVRVEWDLTRDSIRRAETRLAAEWHRAVPVLRLLEVVVDDTSSTSDRFVKDVAIEAGVNSWYVNVPGEGRSFRLHIGYRTPSGVFFAVAKSNVCAMSALNANLPKHSNGRHPTNGKPGTNGHAAGEAHGGHSREGAEIPLAGLGRPLGFSSLAHFGPAATEEREKGAFTFKLETELIIHGSTRPGSSLAVQGDPVELRDDGSFTVRVNQPEGRQVMSFTSMSPSGNERRMIVVAVERNTKELERQYFDGGHPEGFAE